MNENNTWVWVGGVFAVVLIIGGLYWWFSAPSAVAPADDTASSASTTPVGNANGETPVVVNAQTSSKTVAAIIAGLAGSSEYASLLSSTGVGTSIAGKGPYTVFVSTDAGFSLLKPGTITNLTAAQKKRLMQYSIVSKVLNVNIQDSGSVKALSGDLLNFTVGPTNLVQVNSSYALKAYKGSNGIVYVINQPLVPPTSGNIMTP